jgi:hypothetical protein
VNQTQRSYRGCNGAAQSRGVRQSARYVGRPPSHHIACPKGCAGPVGRTGCSGARARRPRFCAYVPVTFPGS